MSRWWSRSAQKCSPISRRTATSSFRAWTRAPIRGQARRSRRCSTSITCTCSIRRRSRLSSKTYGTGRRSRRPRRPVTAFDLPCRGRAAARAVRLDELGFGLGRGRFGERGDRHRELFRDRGGVDALAAERAHLPAQHQRPLAPRARPLEARLAPRTEDKVRLDALLAHRARVVDLDALQEGLFLE